MPRSLARAIVLVVPLLLVAGCPKGNSGGIKTTVGPFPALEWNEKNAEGNLLHCYVLGPESNNPIRICGDGIPSPDHKFYLFDAVQPQSGTFTSNGDPLSPGFYFLRELSERKYEAWKVGRLGAHEWLGEGKILLAVDTEKGTTHVRLVDANAHANRTFDVPLSKSEGFIVLHSPDDKAVLLLQRLGVELAILIHDPLENAYIETLDIPNAKSKGAKKLWQRGAEERARGGVFRITSTINSNVTWKGQEPMYDGLPIGPFESLDERKRRKPSSTPE
jgi:hypothetical protein